MRLINTRVTEEAKWNGIVKSGKTYKSVTLNIIVL